MNYYSRYFSVAVDFCERIPTMAFAEHTISWIKDEAKFLFQVCMPALAHWNQS
jgi:hypothetical protein